MRFLQSFIVLVLAAGVSAFSPAGKTSDCHAIHTSHHLSSSNRKRCLRRYSSNEPSDENGINGSDSDSNDTKVDVNNDGQHTGLVLEGLDQQLGKMASKFSFTESDFLAAARKRAEQRVESKNSLAGDSDWKSLAEEKKNEYGEVDDWENSVKVRCLSFISDCCLSHVVC
jgi:hypothetical protein